MTRLIALIILQLAAPVGSFPVRADDAPGHKGITIVQIGVDADKRFSIIADSAEIGEVLKALFGKAGDDFLIDQDVSGPISLKLTNVPMDEIFRRIETLAKPPLRIQRDGKQFKVSIAPQDTKKIAVIQNPNGLSFNQIPGIVPGVTDAYQNVTPASRPVSIEVPKNRPITLGQALQQISRQTGFPVRLDPRIPAGLTFSGTITRSSLGMVLQALADTTNLKIVDYGTSAVLVPTDQFIVRMNDVLVGQKTGISCPTCGVNLATNWKYCPNCGRPTALATQQRGNQKTLPGPGRRLPE